MPDESGTITLTPPVSDRDRAFGLATALVTLVEYGDYECPHCYHAHFIVKDIQKWLGNGLRFVFRHFPLTQVHPHAQGAAEAAEAAGAQGKFWQMHDTLFEHQQMLTSDDLTRYATSLNLDVVRFTDALRQHLYEKPVQDDYMSGVESGVTGTPTFFINGVRYDGSWDLDDLLIAIERAGASLETLLRKTRKPSIQDDGSGSD